MRERAIRPFTTGSLSSIQCWGSEYNKYSLQSERKAVSRMLAWPGNL